MKGCNFQLVSEKEEEDEEQEDSKFKAMTCKVSLSFKINSHNQVSNVLDYVGAINSHKGKQSSTKYSLKDGIKD